MKEISNPYDFPEIIRHNELLLALEARLPEIFADRSRKLAATGNRDATALHRVDIIRVLTLHNDIDRFRDDPEHFFAVDLRKSHADLCPELAGAMQELTDLTNRIFAKPHPDEYATIWINQSLTFPGPTNLTLQQAAQDWEEIQDNIDLLALNRNDFLRSTLDHKTPAPPRGAIQSGKSRLVGWLQCQYTPQRGTDAVMYAINLHQAGRAIIGSGNYQRPETQTASTPGQP